MRFVENPMEVGSDLLLQFRENGKEHGNSLAGMKALHIPVAAHWDLRTRSVFEKSSPVQVTGYTFKYVNLKCAQDADISQFCKNSSLLFSKFFPVVNKELCIPATPSASDRAGKTEVFRNFFLRFQVLMYEDQTQNYDPEIHEEYLIHETP